MRGFLVALTLLTGSLGCNHFQNGQTPSKPEEMTSYELRYERQQTKNLWLAASAFYQDLDVLGLNLATAGGGHELLGSYQTFGIELEATYKTGDTAITASHSYTQLVGQDLKPGTLSVAPSDRSPFEMMLFGGFGPMTQMTVRMPESSPCGVLSMTLIATRPPQKFGGIEVPNTTPQPYDW